MKTGRILRDGECLVSGVGMASTWWLRLRGLLFRPALGASGLSGLVLTPCASIHTLGMGYPLDIVFLDAGGRVLTIRERLPPWRSCLQRGARSVLELPSGAIQALRIRTGERLEWQVE